jgi:hypothetical protein
VRRAGIVLLEALVAAGILAVIGLAVLGALTSSAKEVKTTSEYSLALFLSQKIAEDVVQSANEDFHFEEELLSINGSRIGVASSAHPYFAALEDSNGTLGLLEPGTDLSVTPIDPSLFRLYREYGLTINSSNGAIPNVPGSPQALCNVELHYDWPKDRNGDRDFRFPLVVPRAIIAQPGSPALAQDIPGLHAAVATTLYPTVSGSLPAVVTAVGGNLPIVQDIGSIVVLMGSQSDQESAASTVLTTLELQVPSSPPNPSQDAEVEIIIGKLYERQAALIWQTLLYLKDPAVRNATTLTATDLGNKSKYSPLEVTGKICQSAGLWRAFTVDLACAINAYTRARGFMNGPTLRYYRRMMLDRKIVELLELKALTDQSPDLTYLQGYLTFLLDFYSGHVRSFTDYVVREQPNVASLSQLQLAYPDIVARIGAANTAASALKQLAQRAQVVLVP